MSAVEFGHQAAVAGRVVEAATGRPVGGAQVTLSGGPAPFGELLALSAMRYGAAWPTMTERADRTRTAADGHFVFLDLPDGQYTVTAGLPQRGVRYGTTQAMVQIGRDGDGVIAIVHIDLELAATSIAGQVTAVGGGPIMMAAVTLEGSGEEVLSDAQGRYMLAGVETGERALVASAQGYTPVRTTASLQAPGATLDVNFTLPAVTPA
jgi:hypothetical protein